MAFGRGQIHAFENLQRAIGFVEVLNFDNWLGDFRHSNDALRYYINDLYDNVPRKFTVLPKEKGLSLVGGFCWRYQNARRALFEKILNLLDCFVGNVFLEFYQHNLQ